MGNLSLNKELDFILKVNEWRLLPEAPALRDNFKHVTVRTIRMTQHTAATFIPRSSTAAVARWTGSAEKAMRSPRTGLVAGQTSAPIPKTPPIARGVGFIDEARPHLLCDV
jgi:hypothetical protein